VNAVFPRHVAPVVRQSEDGEREIVLMSWGFMRLEKGRVPRPVTNVRDDQIRTNPFWRDSFQKRRCLVPASSFCEPNGDVKPTTWNWFALKGDDERPLFAFPGIWRRYQGAVKKDGPSVDIETYSFLTTTPNPLVATINHERMPVLLTHEEEFQTWLNGTPDEAFALAGNILPIAWRSCRRAMTRKTCSAVLPSSGGPARCCRGQRLASCRLALR
jgi:putative SOS response-associated peptidase YedK